MPQKGRIGANDKTFLMNKQAIFTFLSDFQIERFEFLKNNEIMQVVAKINVKYARPSEYSSGLNLEGFNEFVLQMGHFMFADKTSEPSEFMPLLLDRLSAAAHATKEPMFQKTFDQVHFEEKLGEYIIAQRQDKTNPDGSDLTKLYEGTTDMQQVLIELTLNVNDIKNFDLPKGFVKVQ